MWMQVLNLHSWYESVCSKTNSTLVCSITQKIHPTLGNGEGKGHRRTSDDLFPLLPGSHLDLTNPALEFVKSICKVSVRGRSGERVCVIFTLRELYYLCCCTVYRLEVMVVQTALNSAPIYIWVIRLPKVVRVL